jgi:hypothetical protein
VGRGQLAFVLGQHRLGLVVAALGSGNVFGNAVLTLVQSGGNRSPGKLAQNGHQQQEHDKRPQRQVRAELSKIRLGRRLANMRPVPMVTVVRRMIAVRVIRFSCGTNGISSKRGCAH